MARGKKEAAAAAGKRKAEPEPSNVEDEDDHNDEEEEEVVEEAPAKPPKGKKTKKEEEPKAPLTDAEKAKKAGYAKLMRREGAREVGSKEIPVGKPNCLGGLKFVITGVLDSIGDRKAGEAIVKKYGGAITSAVSKKTNYLVVGREPGDSKLSKAAEHDIKVLNEDEFLELIRVSESK